ncbi:hypothetical protein [Cupriavidus sp. TMH.W2]|uniref:hypothetical protein n=1 Tax=Cupriavidus sp. TMH.W2 TaxID=3434465 RepID=UPI003D781DAE
MELWDIWYGTKYQGQVWADDALDAHEKALKRFGKSTAHVRTERAEIAPPPRGI